jgi:hypothetical protein
VSDIRSSRQVEFLPYVLGSVDRYQDEEKFDRLELNGGLDAKVGISSDYTLDLTVNPDFGQVEADPSVLNLTAFEIFFEEKRPFFLEGNEIFDFDIDGDIPYYSRRIGAAPDFPDSYDSWLVSEIPDWTTILGAAKLTGKSRKGLSVGLVNGLTAREYGKAVNEFGEKRDIEVSPMSNYLATRFKQEFKEGETTLGGVFSMVNRISADSVSRERLPGTAVSGGLDLLHYWNNRNYFFEVKTIASRLTGSPEAILRKQIGHIHRFQRPDADYLEFDSLRDDLAGHGGLFRIGKGGGNLNFSLQGQYRSPGLNLNDMGYIRQSDFFGQKAEISYEMTEPKKRIRSYTLTFSQEALWSFGGENTLNQVGMNLQGMNNDLWRLYAILENNFSHLDTRELRGGPALRIDNHYSTGISIGSNPSKDLTASVGLSHSGFGVKGSRSEHLRFILKWLPVRKITLQGNLAFEQRSYHQQYVTTLSGNSGHEYIIGNIDRHTTSFTFRGELFFTPELSLQYYGSPYYSVGKFDSFRRVNQASARDINQRLEILDVIYDPASGEYSFDRNSETFTFSNPDFSFMQFRSNLVFRWEYKLGSTIYFVWSHDRSDWQSHYNPVKDITGDLFRISGNNVFMIKINFWFSV